MLWALLAAFLRRRPPWVQAGMLGLCTGLFVVADVNAGQRDLRWIVAVALGLTIAAPSAWGFFRALRAEVRGRTAGRQRAPWVHVASAAVWLAAVTAAVSTLLGDGGVRVAVIAIVPIVLLAPAALVGVGALLRRRSGHDPVVPRVLP